MPDPVDTPADFRLDSRVVGMCLPLEVPPSGAEAMDFRLDSRVVGLRVSSAGSASPAARGALCWHLDEPPKAEVRGSESMSIEIDIYTDVA